MRTQRLNFIQALNFVLAGYSVRTYSEDAKVLGIVLDSNVVKLKMNATVSHPLKTTRVMDGKDMLMLSQYEYHAGDDKSIKGYFKE